MQDFKEQNGKDFEFKFAIHTDTEQIHAHITAYGSNADINFTKEHLQSFKEIVGEKSEERGIFDYLNQVFVGNIEEIETYSHIEWEDEFKEDVAMTMTRFSDVLVRRGREEGRKEGREEGRIEGREIGQEETTVKFIWSLHEMKCTDEMISEAVKRPIDYVQDILKKDAPQ